MGLVVEILYTSPRYCIQVCTISQTVFYQKNFFFKKKISNCPVNLYGVLTCWPNNQIGVPDFINVTSM